MRASEGNKACPLTYLMEFLRVAEAFVPGVMRSGMRIFPALIVSFWNYSQDSCFKVEQRSRPAGHAVCRG